MIGPSKVRKRSVSLRGHRTSVSLEDEFWKMLKDLADLRGIGINHFIENYDAIRGHGNLSSFLRLLVLKELQDKISSADANELSPEFSKNQLRPA